MSSLLLFVVLSGVTLFSRVFLLSIIYLDLMRRYR